MYQILVSFQMNNRFALAFLIAFCALIASAEVNVPTFDQLLSRHCAYQCHKQKTRPVSNAENAMNMTMVKEMVEQKLLASKFTKCLAYILDLDLVGCDRMLRSHPTVKMFFSMEAPNHSRSQNRRCRCLVKLKVKLGQSLTDIGHGH